MTNVEPPSSDKEEGRSTTPREPALNDPLDGVRSEFKCGAETSAMPADFPEHSKTISTIRARFALAGWTLVQAPDGALIASRWGRTTTLHSTDAAGAFLARLEGRRG